MDDIILVDGVRYHAEKEQDKNPWVIVRSKKAGHYFGELDEIKGNSVVLNFSRNLLSVKGTISEIAVNGPKNPSDCELRIVVKKRIIFGVVDILYVTEKAQKSLQEYPVWSEEFEG